MRQVRPQDASRLARRRLLTRPSSITALAVASHTILSLIATTIFCGYIIAAQQK
jgi:hypothetical protein